MAPMRVAVAVAVLAAACSFDRGGVAYDGDGRVSDGPVPIVDGGDAGDGPVCEPRCDGDTLITCQGATPTETPCPLGCAGDGAGAHCRQIVPSNDARVDDLNMVTGGLSVPAGATYSVDSDRGSITDLASQTAIRGPIPGFDSATHTAFRIISPTVSVLAIDGLEVAATGRLRIAGGTQRALILLVAGAVHVNGTIDASAGCLLDGAVTQRCRGAGGGHGANAATGVPGAGCAFGGNGRGFAGGGDKFAETGGGGGGLGGSGAAGGDGPGTDPNAGGGGGAVDADCPGPDLVPLLGGSGGGGGGVGLGDFGGGDGGGGGGAIQITSLSEIDVSGSALVIAAGGGGLGPDTARAAGGGGGSGGGILLEAPRVTVEGVVAANGGGGGSGTRVRVDGKAGLPSSEQAPGGAGAGIDESIGRGGKGGARSGPPTAGGAAQGGGGGGAGVGIIRVNGDEIDLGDDMSPIPTQGPLVKR